MFTPTIAAPAALGQRDRRRGRARVREAHRVDQRAGFRQPPDARARIALLRHGRDRPDLDEPEAERAQPSKACAVLSRPAPTPSGEAKSSPSASTRSTGSGRNPDTRPTGPSTAVPSLWAVSASMRVSPCWKRSRYRGATLGPVLRLRLALVGAVLVACAVVAFLLKPVARRGRSRRPHAARRRARRGGRGPVRLDAAAQRGALQARRRGRQRPALRALARRRGRPPAQRVKRFRPQIEQAAKAAGVNPDLLEGLVFLESAGPARRAARPAGSRAPPASRRSSPRPGRTCSA